jgi:hypothetical protein
MSDKPKQPYDAAARKAELQERAIERAKATSEYKAEGDAERAKTVRLKRYERQKKPLIKPNLRRSERNEMEYAVRAETKEGDVVTLKRGFPSRSDAEDYPVRLSRWQRVWIERVDAPPPKPTNG